MLAAVGAGAAGYLTRNPDLGAIGALAGAAGAVAESARTRTSRVKARDERAVLREEVRILAAAVEKLSNEVNARPAMLRPEPLPAFAPAGASMQVVSTFSRPAEPATPRSLPILTANHRGLQSSRFEAAAPVPPTVPAPTAPAPLVLTSAPVATAAIARLVAETPRLQAADVDDVPTTQIPRLATAPAHWTPAEPLPSIAMPAATTAVPRLILGGDRSALPMPRPPATPITGLLLPSFRHGSATSVSEMRVVDLRSSSRVPAGSLIESRTTTAPLTRRSRTTVAATEVVEPISLFEPVRHHEPTSLFEPRPRNGRPGAVPTAPDPQAADGARHAWRGMRPGVPPSPFFTPGAFEGSSRSA